MTVEYLDYLGCKLVVSFQITLIDSDKDEIRCITLCTIANGCEFFSGVAVMHPNESPDVETGRRIAFSRAAKAFAWSRLEKFDGFTDDWEGAKGVAKWIYDELRLARYKAKTAISDDLATDKRLTY
jgi:hypothetical protein